MNNKDIDLIPQGAYCYELLSIDKNGVQKIRSCPYYKCIIDKNNQYIQYCELLKCELSIQDQIKDCGINDNDND